MLQNKKIILAISGSIAAYKAAVLSRLFVKAGAQVKVIMTPSAANFITPLTLATLTKNPVLINFEKNNQGEWNNHVELGLWADVMLIAPASANTIAKMANGICDNLLLATYLSARCPVMVAPAMDLDMYSHATTQKNIDRLKTNGNILIDVAHGELASGLVGSGRMAEPENIVAAVNNFFNTYKKLSGKKVLVTAGPTIEPIDPVRFISNRSSGKMGYLIAEAFANEGAMVTLISGPTQCTTINSNISIMQVNTAAEMLEAATLKFKGADIAVMTAAVADYSPAEKSNQKIKKNENNWNIFLHKTTDILKTLGVQKKNNQLLVGFALETENAESNALKKLNDKNADMIVLNVLNEENQVFGSDKNKITIFKKNGDKKHFEPKLKSDLAKDIVNEIILTLHA